MADLLASTAAEKDRYLRRGYSPLSCDSCATRVQVRKFSGEQTSVQWLTPATGCPELAAHAAIGQSSALVPTCAELHRTIDKAFEAGLVEVGHVD